MRIHLQSQAVALQERQQFGLNLGSGACADTGLIVIPHNRPEEVVRISIDDAPRGSRRSNLRKESAQVCRLTQCLTDRQQFKKDGRQAVHRYEALYSI